MGALVKVTPRNPQTVQTFNASRAYKRPMYVCRMHSVLPWYWVRSVVGDVYEYGPFTREELTPVTRNTLARRR